MLPGPLRNNRLRRHRAVLGGHLEVGLDLEVLALPGVGDQTRRRMMLSIGTRLLGRSRSLHAIEAVGEAIAYDKSKLMA